MERPNILVFLSDDHGQWASRPYGNSELVTPTLDYLARTGARMENAFTPCPACSPARASFHTGRIPSAHGIHDHIGEQNVGAAHPGIAGQTSLAEVLQGQGYQTGLVGKWHLNHFREPPPGWETWFSNATGTNARFGAQRFYEGNRRVELHGNQAHHLADRAVSFLRERDRGRPFYLFVGLFMTLADAAGCVGAELAHTRGRTGRSCLPLLSESAAVAAAAAREWRDAQVCEYGNARMIRTARHKLIKRYPGPNGHFPDELYDLADDPDEEHNRYGDPAYAGPVAELAARLEAHFARHEDPARSGLRVADLPIHNNQEPWRVNAAGG